MQSLLSAIANYFLGHYTFAQDNSLMFTTRHLVNKHVIISSTWVARRR
jgi:hypothetical protein